MPLQDTSLTTSTCVQTTRALHITDEYMHDAEFVDNEHNIFGLVV